MLCAFACCSLEFTLPDLICTCTTLGCFIIKPFVVISMQVGIWWWPRNWIRAMPAMPSVTNSPCRSKHWQVLVWVVMSLLSLVAGSRSRFQAEYEAAVGFAGMVELPLEAFPDTEEELEEDSDSPWHGLFEPSVLFEDDQQPARWERSPRSPDTSDIQTKGARKKKKKKEKEEKKKKEKSSRGHHSSRDCHLEKREMRVRDLGMGFDSDEIVLFKFCVGSCQRSRGNYDLALRALLANGSLPKRTARKVSAHPCCRPVSYEPVSFMDATTTWRTIKSLSAADCECVG
ncbi:glial cell line-derived neurotrophic factor-like isoform X1 [Carassius carassius]|uniref:glial cell line-derived neurotrophic factor-like isoform X1 n=1 Tax=Carassius carassius TaxID=217509 RepID=UPI002868D828|nr:glial cell line-derived neurotrophic factor-like isoform X1 [Carassius carassius]